ncbi:MAG: hypothetical protein WC785_09545 [Tatlockia sp.]
MRIEEILLQLPICREVEELRQFCEQTVQFDEETIKEALAKNHKAIWIELASAMSDPQQKEKSYLYLFETYYCIERTVHHPMTENWGKFDKLALRIEEAEKAENIIIEKLYFCMSHHLWEAADYLFGLIEKHRLPYVKNALAILAIQNLKLEIVNVLMSKGLDVNYVSNKVEAKTLVQHTIYVIKEADLYANKALDPLEEKVQKEILQRLLESHSIIAKCQRASSAALKHLAIVGNSAAFSLLLSYMPKRHYYWGGNRGKAFEFSWYQPLLSSPYFLMQTDWREKLRALPIDISRTLRKDKNSALFQQILKNALSAVHWQEIFVELKVTKKDFKEGYLTKEFLIALSDHFPRYSCRPLYRNNTDANGAKPVTPSELDSYGGMFFNRYCSHFHESYYQLAYFLERGGRHFISEMSLPFLEKLIKNNGLMKIEQDFEAVLALLIHHGLDINSLVQPLIQKLSKFCLQTSEFINCFYNVFICCGANAQLVRNALIENLLDINKEKLDRLFNCKDQKIIDFHDVISQRISPFNRIQEILRKAFNVIKNEWWVGKIGKENWFFRFSLVKSLYQLKSMFKEIDKLGQLLEPLQKQEVIQNTVVLKKKAQAMEESLEASKMLLESNTIPDPMQGFADLTDIALNSFASALFIVSNPILIKKIPTDKLCDIAIRHQDRGILNNVGMQIQTHIEEEIRRRMPDVIKATPFNALLSLASTYNSLSPDTMRFITAQIDNAIVDRLKNQTVPFNELNDFSKVIALYKSKSLCPEDLHDNFASKLQLVYNLYVLKELQKVINNKFTLAAENHRKTPWQLGWFGTSTKTITFAGTVYPVPRTIYHVKQLLDSALEKNWLDIKCPQTAREQMTHVISGIHNLLDTKCQEELTSLNNMLKTLFGCGRSKETKQFYESLRGITSVC